MANADAIQTEQPDLPNRKSGFFHYLAAFVTAGGWIVVMATIGCFFARANWFADLLCSFRVQYLMLLFVAILASLAIKKKFSVAAFVLCFAINAVPIAPYIIPPPAVGEPAPSIIGTKRVMTFNVLTHNHRFGEVAEFIKRHDPDFLVLLEIDNSWIDSVGPQIAAQYEFSKTLIHDGNFGIGIWSKVPWERCEIIPAKPSQLPTVEAILKFSDKTKLHFIGTHPIPPMGRGPTESRDTQLRSVAKWFEGSEHRMLVGDFNLTPWSPVFDDVLEAGRLVDSALGQSPAPTWQLFPTWLGGVKIDHVLVSPNVRVKQHQISERLGSDHCPVLVDFEL